MGHCKSNCPKLERKKQGQQGHSTNETSLLRNPRPGANRISAPLSADSRPLSPHLKGVKGHQNTVDPTSTFPGQVTQKTTQVSSRVTPDIAIY
jgi:hypothetical protein